MGRRPTACQKCATIKAKCTGQVPCSRCQRLRLPCSLSKTPARLVVPDHSSDCETAAADKSSPRLAHRLSLGENIGSGSRARHTKSSTGCANCRRRRKKCDERWPTCGDCDRLHLQCLPRSETSPFNIASSSMVTVETPRISDKAIEYRETNSDDDHGDNGQNGDEDEDNDDEDNDDEVSPIICWLDIINKENFADLSYPLSSLAHSSALRVLPDRRASDTAPSEEGVTLPPVALSSYAGIDTAALDSWTTGERHLLNHFLQSVARSMSMVEDEHNPFIRLIVPMAFESTAVRNALAALSATHLSKTYPDFERNHLLHRNMALEDLKWRLGSPETSVSALTATLLLCLGEICECRSRRWLLYLHGARALLKQVAQGAPGPLRDFLIDMYNYICCVGSVTTSGVPRPWGNQFGLHMPDSDGTHALFGCEPDLYRYLARINRLSGRRTQLTDSDSLSTIQLEAQAYDADLQNWEGLRDIDSEAKAAACAVRWALILRLREVAWPGLEMASPQIQGPVNNINTALSLIRPGSRAESHLLLSIFMAGVGSITKASRLMIEYRVNIAEKTIGFGSVAAIHHLLDDLWRRANNGGEAVAWHDVVQSQMPGLMLF